MRNGLVFLVILIAAPAFAQQAAPSNGGPNSGQQDIFGKHDRNAPIHLSANSSASDVKEETGDFVGNVIVTQGDMKMHADRMHVDTAKGDISQIIATGNVVVTTSTGIGTGDRGIYDVKSRLVTMTGKVVLTKKKDVMRGTKLVMDLNTNLAHLTADGSQGGRVQAVFIPKQHPDSGEKPQNPADNSGK